MRPMRTAIVATVFAAALWWPAFQSPMATGFGDWQMIHHNLEAALASVRAGDLPLWDPFHCGGVTSLGNPESQHFAPWVMLLALVIGSTLTTKVLLLVHAALGAAGAYYYARRRHGLHVVAACLVAGAWAGSGFFSWQMAGGHFTFVPYYLIPWLLLVWRRCLTDLRYVPAVALILGAMIFEAGTYPVPHALLAMALDLALAFAPGTRSEPGARVPITLRRAAGHITLAALLTLLLTTVRWLPITQTLALFPRSVSSTDTPTLLELMSAWVETESEWRVAGRLYVWPEYCAYLGWPIVGAAVLGLPRALRRHRAPLVALAFFLVLAMGSFHPWAPWALLHELPVYDSLRVPSRLQALITFYLAMLAGIGLDAFVRFFSDHFDHAEWWQGVSWGFVAFALAFPIAFNAVNNARWDRPPVGDSEPRAARFHLVPTPDYAQRYARLPRENRGTRSCYVGAMDWTIARGLWMGDGLQARTDAGTVANAWRTPNRFWLEVDMDQAGVVLLNQNHHPDWKPDVGTVEDVDGLLAVALEPGHHELSVAYRPGSWWPGVLASILGLLGALGLWGWSHRRGSLGVLSGRDS